MPHALLIAEGADRGRQWTLDDGASLVVGRGRDADVRLDDESVSRTHCRFDALAGRVTVTDLGSRGGTELNGAALTGDEKKAVSEGDKVALGGTVFVLRDGEPDATETTLAGKPAPADAPAGDLSRLVGTTLHHYKIEREIARGSTGTVFFAKRTDKPKMVALKVLWPHLTADSAAHKRFLRGMKAMYPVRHPNVVRIHNAGRTGDLTWVALEYVPGENLSQTIERIGTAGMLDWQTAYRATVQIARALEAAAEHGIVHRNLTPGSILYRPEAKVAKLADLGLAKALGGGGAELTTRGEVVGNPEYLAPEQLKGDPDLIDARSDLYGLGAMAYALLTGRPPFEADSPAKLIVKVMTEDPPPPKTFQLSVNDQFAGVVMKLLAKNPDDRYPTATATLKDLERVGTFANIKV